MLKIISCLNITADGFCDHQDVIADDEHHQWVNQLMETVGCVILGRKTFQLFESFWPTVLNDENQPKPVLEFAQHINEIKKVVFSKTLNSAKWQNTVFLGDINAEGVLKLKQESKKNMLIFGSPSIISELSQQGMIDEYYFAVQPILAGKGKHLFENIALNESLNLKLKDTKNFISGVTIHHYSF